MLELFAIVLTIGALLYYTLHVSMWFIGVCAVVLAGFVIVITRSRRGVVLALIAGGALMLGAVSVWRVDTPIDRKIYGNRAFDARVLSVDRRIDRTNIVIVDTQHNQKLQVRSPQQVQVLPGDFVSVRGVVAPIEDFVTDSGRVFAYEAYMGSKGIVGVVTKPIIGPVTDHEFALARVPTILRYRIADIFARYIQFPFDGVVAGMTVGYQGGLPDAISDLFRDTGVLHVLVLSGYNITLLAGFLGLMLKGVPFKLRSAITVIAILMLVLISGAGVASVRAGVMGGIAVLAGLSVRTYQPMRALVVAYLCFFFISPTMVFVDPGFHLSFLATMFMILVLPKIEALFHWIPETQGIDLRELIMLAVSAPVFMLPYLMYFSGNFPLSSPLANIVFAIVTPVIMIGGIVLVSLAFVPTLASIVGSLISVLGSFVLGLLELCARIPIWHTPPVPWWCVSLVYGALVFALFRREISEYMQQQYRMFRRQPSASG